MYKYVHMVSTVQYFSLSRSKYMLQTVVFLKQKLCSCTTGLCYAGM